MRRAAAIVLALALAGCGESLDVRVGDATLDRAVSRAFKRHFEAAVRMSSGQADRGIVRHAGVRCTPYAAEPEDDSEPWRWRCRVLWYLRDSGRPNLATYGLRVDQRGCFEARSGAFPDLRFDRLRDRRSGNPLVYMRSCS